MLLIKMLFYTPLCSKVYCDFECYVMSNCVTDDLISRVRDCSGIPRRCGDTAESPTPKVVQAHFRGNAQKMTYEHKTGINQ